MNNASAGGMDFACVSGGVRLPGVGCIDSGADFADSPDVRGGDSDGLGIG